MRFPRGRANGLIAIALLAGLVLGLGLIFLPADSSDDAPDREPSPEATLADEDPDATDPPTPGVTLPLQDLSADAVEEFTGLRFPADMTEFLTAKLDSNTQLDITFDMPTASTEAFLSESGLPAPTPDERLILHSSPMWKLNPDEGTTLSSSTSVAEGVRRVVELVGDGSGTIVVRIVVTPT